MKGTRIVPITRPHAVIVGGGLWQWDAASIQREKDRYEKTLQAGFEILTRKDDE